jgi:hypothetical protein
MLINSPNISGSLKVTGNAVITGSLTVLGGINATITGSATSASYVEYSNVANKPTLVSGSEQVSFNGIVDKPTLVSGSEQITYSGISSIPSGIVSSSTQITGYNIFATTGSNQFNGSQVITGSLTVTGQVVAQTLNVQQVTSSIVFSSGSNIFGNDLGNTQQFTGSVSVTGSLAVAGAGSFSGTGYFGGATVSSGLTGASELIVQNELGIQNGDTTGPYLRMVMGGVNQNITLVTGAFTGTEPNLLFSIGGATRLTMTPSGSATFNLGSGEMRLNRTGTSEYLKLNTYYLLTDGNDQLLGSVTGATSIYAGSGVSPKLTIASTGAATFQTTGNNGIINIGGSTYYSQLETNSTLGGLKIKSIWGAANSGIIQFINGTSENIRMHIADNGNVDIGLTNAIDRLTISRNVADNAGGITLYNAETSGYGSALTFRVNYAGVYNVSRIHGDWGTGNSGLLHFFTANTSQTLVERMLINGSGNVIIGNTTAYGGLTVSDFTTNDGNDSLAFFYRGTSGGHESLIKFYDFRGQVNASMGNNLEDDGSGTQKARLVFKTSNSGAPTERMRITSNGTLEFLGVATGLAGAYFTNDSSSLKIHSTFGGGTTKDLILQSGGSAGAPQLILKAGGNVLIGTTDDIGYKLNVNGSLRFSTGQTGGYVRRDSGFVNETANIGENATAYFLYKYTADANGSSTTFFNITGLSNNNGTCADINLRVRKDATASAINTVGYIQINGQDMIGAVFASGTAAVQTNRTIRVVRMSDEWIIIGSVGSY